MNVAGIETTWSSPPESISAAPKVQPGQAPFADLIGKLVSDADAKQVQADQAIKDFALGRADNLHQVMLSLAQAELSFKLILEIRNRLTEAYQEIMRMQV